MPAVHPLYFKSKIQAAQGLKPLMLMQVKGWTDALPQYHQTDVVLVQPAEQF